MSIEHFLGIDRLKLNLFWRTNMHRQIDMR